MNILLTGGSGFIGRNLREGLSGSYQIFVPSHRELDLLESNQLTTYVKQHQIDTIIHSAVYSALADGRDAGMVSDLRMFAQLVQVAPRMKKIIYFGSGAEYGKQRDLVKVSESDWGSHIPEDAYGIAKYMMQSVTRREPQLLNLRPFGIYGPYEDYRSKFISNAIVKHLLHLPIVIKQNVIFDYLDVADLGNIVDHFLTNDHKFADYNVTPTQATSLVEIAQMINLVGKRDAPIQVLTPGLNYQYTGDNTRLLSEMPNFRFRPLEQSIKELYNYYKGQLAMIDESAVRQDNYLVKARTKTK